MKARYVVILLAVFFVIFGCSKTAQQTENSAEQTAEDSADAAAESAAETSAPALGVFVIDGSISELRSDGKMHWKASLNTGDTVGWTGEKREAVRAYDGQTRTFYRVEADGEFWVHDYFIAGPAVTAVITGEETVLYTRPEPAAVTRAGTVTLPVYTLVARLDDAKLDDEYIPIAVHLGGALPEERYVKIENISWNANDIDAVKLARVASFTKNPTARGELLNNAMEIAASGAKLSRAAESVQYDPALFELKMTNNLESASLETEYMVTSETLNIRNFPSVNGEVTGTMKQGDVFWVTARSKTEITLDAPADGAEGETEKPKGVWLRLGEGQWAFSAYAVENPALR